MISSQFDRPVIVHRYPSSLKAFYFKHDPNDDGLALNMDVLAPEGYGEIIGGGQREEDIEKLVAAIDHHKLPPEAFEWYLDVRRYGSFPHAGFGLGIERTVAWICGLPHVRETIPFPRMLNRLGAIKRYNATKLRHFRRDKFFFVLGSSCGPRAVFRHRAVDEPLHSRAVAPRRERVVERDQERGRTSECALESGS